VLLALGGFFPFKFSSHEASSYIMIVYCDYFTWRGRVSHLCNNLQLPILIWCITSIGTWHYLDHNYNN
jgi:hypothetical protein